MIQIDAVPHCANEQVVAQIGDGIDKISRDRVGVKGIGGEIQKTAPVKTAQTGIGRAHPNESFPVLLQAGDKTLLQALFNANILDDWRLCKEAKAEQKKRKGG